MQWEFMWEGDQKSPSKDLLPLSSGLPFLIAFKIQMKDDMKQYKLSY